MQLSLCIGNSVCSLLADIIPTLRILSSISLKLSRLHPKIQIHEYRSLQRNVKTFWKCWPRTRVSKLLEHFIRSLSWQSMITCGSSEPLAKNYLCCWKGRQCFTSQPQLATFSYQDKRWYKLFFFLFSCVKIDDDNVQSEHKIQSGKGSLSIEMDQVPKILKPMVDEWTRGGFIVSFKVSRPFILFFHYINPRPWYI